MLRPTDIYPQSYVLQPEDSSSSQTLTIKPHIKIHKQLVHLEVPKSICHINRSPLKCVYIRVIIDAIGCLVQEFVKDHGLTGDRFTVVESAYWRGHSRQDDSLSCVLKSRKGYAALRYNQICKLARSYVILTERQHMSYIRVRTIFRLITNNGWG
jgi:hypothetical protein